MANLSISEITRDGKEYRTDLLVDKVFQLNGKTNVFNTTNGIFNAVSILIDGLVYADAKESDRIKSIILGMKGLRGSKLEIKGSYAGKTTSSIIPIKDIEKSEEFGGQPVGGKKENKGIKFEKDFGDDLARYLEGQPCTVYAKAIEYLVDECSKQLSSPVKQVVPLGAFNQKRPLVLSGSTLVIDPPNPKDHAKKLTDIDVNHKDNRRSHLSLKHGGTLTFVNAGISQILSKTEIEKGKINNTTGKKLLDSFGIDESLFCRTFNEYNKGSFKGPSVKVTLTGDKKVKFKKLLSTMIGCGYWMVHGHEGGKVDIWYMDPAKIEMMSNITGPIEILYGGSNGKGKRIDISFSNSYFDFKINIRNKQGGQYPSHIMCDYKSKSSLNKKHF